MSDLLSRRPFHVMAKPIGPVCNLDCSYCFYLEKEKLFKPNERFAMPDDILEEYIRQFIQSQPGPEISFAWQGGEPTLLGVDYFRKIVELQAKYASHYKIRNAIQTNGTLLTDEWCEFFKKHDFLVGLSIDGPRELHDQYRVDKRQKPTFDRVMAGLNLLKKYEVEFNTLTVVNRANSKQPDQLYQFLKDIGSNYIQFIPLVERRAHTGGLSLPPQLDEITDLSALLEGLHLAAHSGQKGNLALKSVPVSPVTEWSVTASDYGEFLLRIFKKWVRHDVGRVFVQLFDVALGSWMGLGSSLCIFAENCGSAVALEHNGDLYSCDHYVYPNFKLGNLLNQSLGEMVESPAQRQFGTLKSESLPEYCRQCEVRFACNGECPKNRFIQTADGQPGLNYLCPAYKLFFKAIDPCMKTMAQFLNAQKPAAEIMPLLRNWERVERNAACPCGSGRKFKQCHMPFVRS